MAKINDLSESIVEINKALAKLRKDRAMWDDADVVLDFFEICYNVYRAQIHDYLYSLNTDASEKKTRELCASLKTLYLPIFEQKIKEYRKNREVAARFYVMQDKFEALVAYRDLEQYALYMEKDLPEDKKIITMAYANRLIQPILYTSQQMVLEGTIKKLFKNTPTGYFKCVKADTEVRTPKGNIQIKDLNIGDEVYSMKDNKLCVERVTDKAFTFKPQVKIKTRGGKPIIVSPEHRLLTQRGYVEAQNITQDDYLYRQCCTIENGTPIPDLELEFITMMIFEGHCKKDNFGFTQENNLVLNKFMDVCDKLGLKYSLHEKEGSKGLTCKVLSNQGKTLKLLEKYGIFGELATEKRLPNCFFTMPLEQKFKFIGLMLATDGYIGRLSNRGGNTCGINLANEGLIYDIQSLFDTCGIYTSVTPYKSKFKGKSFNAWNLYIPDEYLHIIYENCYLYDKQIKLEDRIKEVDARVIRPYCNNTNYPKEVVSMFKSVRKYCNKQFSRNKSFKKEIINLIYEKDKSLESVIYKDFVWEKIDSIDFDETCVDMVDICVSNTHNFIANGIVSHNSYSDVIIISWILGYNISGDCLKVVGNPKMVTKVVNGVSSMMLMKRYSQVFPFYQKYECNPGLMFKILAPRAGEMLLMHATGIDFSLLCISKETPIDGGRYKYRFYDDITNSKYKTNITMHDADDAAYNDQWKKRRYTEFDDCEWFTGTVYFYLDFLSRRRNENGFELAVPLKKFRYTKYCKEKKSVFIVIPKLDYDTDECTFPQIYSTEQAKIDRSNDFETFMAMEQGLPTIPEGMPFDYSNMKVWKELPLKESEGGLRSDFCMAALDLPRTGDNNLSLIIFSKCGDLYYLVDAIYQKKPLDTKFEDGKTMLDLVCEKIKYRMVKNLVVENNVCSNIKEQIENKLQMLHYSCKVDEVYSTMKKQDKIFDSQADIQQHIVIPANGIFGLSSDVGKAVYEIVTWSTKAKSDDSIDTVSMFVRRFINDKSAGFAVAHTFKR